MPVPQAGSEDPKKQLRSFLGMASYARKFIKDYAKKSQPLNQLLEKGVAFEWTDQCQAAWDEIIEALCEKVGLWPPDYDQPLYIRTDACAKGLGAYLFQIVEVEVVTKSGKVRLVKEERVIEFWSRSVPVPMRQYDARRLEMLAVIMALEHFKPFIEGVRVQLDTDHRNLTWIQNVKHSSGQLARWAMRLSEFNFDLRYRPGVDNQVADALSRNPLPQELSNEEASSVMLAVYFQRLDAELCASAHYVSDTPTYMVTWGKIVDPELSLGSDGLCYARTRPTPEVPSDDEDVDVDDDLGEQDMDRLMSLAADTVTIDQIGAAQLVDEYAAQVKKSLRHSPRKNTVRQRWTLRDNVLYARADGVEEADALRIYVPEPLRNRLMAVFHRGDFMMHAGRAATYDAIARRYYWKGMEKDIGEYIRHCLMCRKAKAVLPRRAGKLRQTFYDQCGSTLSIDLVGPWPPTADGFNYILTILDPFSHFLVAVPIANKRAITVLDAFVKNVVLKGILPSRLVFDGNNGWSRSNGRVVSDNGGEFKNELFQAFLNMFDVRFGYTIPYHPQSNPVERVHRFINSLVRASVQSSTGPCKCWSEALPYVVFAYNQMFIPGTQVSPFMLHLGRQPMIPEDLQRVELHCENQTFEEKIKLITGSMKVYTEGVKKAHEIQRQKQKVGYDERRIEVSFEIGEFVLWHGPQRKNKLQFHWHGPYRIKEKINDVKYVVEDPLTLSTRNVSVQQIVPVLGEFDIMEGGEDLLEPVVELQSLKVGHCIIFKRHDDKRLRDVHVAEVVAEYDALDRSITVHHLADLGPKDDVRSWRKNKPLKDRRVYHEYRDSKGVSTTLKRKTRAAKAGELPLHGDYDAQSITILVKNFMMQSGGKIPRDVCARAEKWFKDQEEAGRVHIGPDDGGAK